MRGWLVDWWVSVEVDAEAVGDMIGLSTRVGDVVAMLDCGALVAVAFLLDCWPWLLQRFGCRSVFAWLLVMVGEYVGWLEQEVVENKQIWKIERKKTRTST
jgi:hypothetical protein